MVQNKTHCRRCDHQARSQGALERHLVDEHGVDPLDAPSEVETGNIRTDQSPPPIAEAAKNLGKARQHGNLCDVVAVLVLGGAILAAVGIVADDEIPAVLLFMPLGSGLVAFALLRAVALHLHLAVDRVMVEGVDD